MIPRILSLFLLTFALTVEVRSQSLAELVEEGNTGWLFGNWTGTTDDGDKLEASFKWDLDRQIIVSESSNPRWKTKAMTAVDPETGEPGFVGYSSLGSSMKGKWDVVDGNPILRVKIKTRDRDDMDVALRYVKVDADSMKLEFLQVEGGEVVEPARWSTVFKRVR